MDNYKSHTTPQKANMTLENPPFSIGNTSSTGGFSIVMLVFRGVLDMNLEYYAHGSQKVFV